MSVVDWQELVPLKHGKQGKSEFNKAASLHDHVAQIVAQNPTDPAPIKAAVECLPTARVVSERFGHAGTWENKEERTMPTRRAREMRKRAEERMKNAEQGLRSFTERPDRQYSSEEKAENKRLLDVLRLAMVEYSEAFDQAVRS